MLKKWLLLIILFRTLTSCLSPLETTIKRREHVKERILRLLNKYPDILKADTVTVYKRDTSVTERLIIRHDTVVLPVEYIDSTIGMKYDSLYVIQEGLLTINAELKSINGKNELRLKVTKAKEVVYISDTIVLHDTTFLTQIKTEYTKTLDLEPSFLWSLWFTFKSWLWLVILLAAFIITFKMLKK